jgi:hypothetical protein
VAQIFPCKEEWFHVYAGGSYIVDWVNIGAGVFSDLFSFCAPVRHIGLGFAREVVTILLALTHLARIGDIYSPMQNPKRFKTCNTSST